MKRIKFFLYRAAAAVLVIALTIMCLISLSPRYLAAESASVSSADELRTALANNNITTINIIGSSLNISGDISIDRSVTISGGGAELHFSSDSHLIVEHSGELTLSDVRLYSSHDYTVVSSGKVILGASTAITGRYGISLREGASLTSDGKMIDIDDDTEAALSINAQQGEVTLYDLNMIHTSGSGVCIALEPCSGEVVLGGTVKLDCYEGCAILSKDTSCPSLTIENKANITISAPDSQSGYSAIHMPEGTLTIGDDAVVSVTGGIDALKAADAVIGKGVQMIISCSAADTSDELAFEPAAMYLSGQLTCGEDSSITVAGPQKAISSGIYAAKGISFGPGSTFTMQGNGGSTYAMRSPESVSFGNGCYINLRDINSGIICSKDVILGDAAIFDFGGISNQGVSADGKISFGSNSTVNILCDGSAIVSKGTVELSKGADVRLSGGKIAPALHINSSQGMLSAKDSSSLTTISSDNCGILCNGGNVIIETSASIYSYGKCGLRMTEGNITVNSGGGLFAQGVSDSAVKLDSGTITFGKSARIDAQGQKYGIEISKAGSLSVDAAEAFDIRSTTGRALFIGTGSVIFTGTKTLSAWYISDNKDNTTLWWKIQPKCERSWDILKTLAFDEKIYADHTSQNVYGAQSFTGGSALDCDDGLRFYDAEWDATQYSRIGMFVSRPIARSNTFSIPCGKTFAWQLSAYCSNGLSRYEIYGEFDENSIELSRDGVLKYTAPSYSFGEESIQFIVYDKDGIASLPATVNIVITASKSPVAYSTTFATAKNTQLIEHLKIEDSDGSIADTQISVYPEHGDITISSDGIFSYTPDDGYTGVDKFEYYSIDNMGDKSNTGYISISVGERTQAIACNNTIITEQGQPITVDFLTMTSDSDVPTVNGEAFTYALTVLPEYGTLDFAGNSSVTYTPYDDFSGADRFKYIVVYPDGTQSNDAIFTVATVSSQRPLAQDIELYCIKNLVCKGTLSADDVDGKVIEYKLTSEPKSGKITLDSVTGEFTYRAETDEESIVTFTYAAVDNDNLESAEKTVKITVLGLMDWLKITGRFAIVCVAALVIVLAIIFIVIVTASVRARKRKQLAYEQKRQMIIEMMAKRNQQRPPRR